MSAILPARSLPIPGSSDRSRPDFSRLADRLGQALDLARGTAVGADAKLVLSPDLKQFGGLVEHGSDFRILNGHVGDPRKPYFAIGNIAWLNGPELIQIRVSSSRVPIVTLAKLEPQRWALI